MDCTKVHYALQLSTYAWMLQQVNPAFNIKQLNIKVTIGAYAESGLNGTSSDKDTLINILKNSTIDPKNIHVYITCECRDGISEYDIVGPILGYGSKDSVS